MRPLIFAHANSFPAGTYDYLFAQLRARGFAVHALPRFGHDPAYPVTDNWPHLVQWSGFPMLVGNIEFVQLPLDKD